MQARPLNVGNALYERNPYKIPPYQRAYSWEDEQLEDFIKDIYKCWCDQKNGDNSSTLFFGGIVTVAENDSSLKGHHYKVIDGQQRLTTFTILISLVEKHYREITGLLKSDADNDTRCLCMNRAERIRNEYIIYESEVNNKPRTLFRLELSKRDNVFFEKLIRHEDPEVNKDSPDSNKKLKKAYLQIEDKLIKRILSSAASISDKISDLELLSKTALDNSTIIHITGDNDNEGLRLFQVLNDRGIGLTAGDLLRSRTLEIFEDSEHQGYVESVWDKILSDEASVVEHFLRVFYSSRVKERPRKSNLFDDFNDRFFNYKKPFTKSQIKEAINLMKEIEYDFSLFSKVVEGSWPYKEDNNKVCEWDKNRLKLLIKTLGHKLCLPLLLSATMLEQEKFAQLVNITERYVFRYIIICSAHAGKLEDIYYEHSAKIRKEKNKYRLSSMIKVLRDLEISGANDSVFKANLHEKLKYKEGSNKILKYFLVTLDDYIRWINESGQGFPKCFDTSRIYDTTQISIEHVYPQHAKASEINQRLEKIKHDLGNLSFWSQKDNNKANNDSFVAKKIRYKNSDVRLNNDIAKRDKWGLKDIQEREKLLEDYALKVFTI